MNYVRGDLFEDDKECWIGHKNNKRKRMDSNRKLNGDNTRILLDVIFQSATGRSILEKMPSETDRDLAIYAATKETQDEAVDVLRRLGFELAGPPSQYGVSIVSSPRLMREVFGEEPLSVPKFLAKWIEAVRIPHPVKLYGKDRREVEH